MQHVLHEVECTVTRSLGTHQRATPCEALARQHACVVLACELLIHAVHVANLTTAYAHITCGYVGVGTDVLPQFEHEGLAETHNLGIRLTLGAEIRATLCATHRKRREGILECLLETEEFQHRWVHRCVETDTALVGADSAVELHTITQISLNLALVIDPRYAECDDAVGLNHALHDFGALKFGVVVIYLLDRLQYFAYCLQILALTGVFAFEFCHQIINVHGLLLFGLYSIANIWLFSYGC